jgi:hypothetical protein
LQDYPEGKRKQKSYAIGLTVIQVYDVDVNCGRGRWNETPPGSVYVTRFWSSEKRTEGRREQQPRENSGERVLAGRLEKTGRDVIYDVRCVSRPVRIV